MSVSNQVTIDVPTQQRAPWWEILLVMFFSLGIT